MDWIAVIEITLGGFAMVAERTACWRGGADLGALIDGQALAPWRSFKLSKGQKLQFTQPLLGARAYLAAPVVSTRQKYWAAVQRWCAKNLADSMAWACLGQGSTLSYHGKAAQLRE